MTTWRRQRLAGLLFLAPAILYILFAFALPIIYNVMLSFENSSPATISSLTAPFAGLANYRFILNDPTSRQAIVHTLEFTAALDEAKQKAARLDKSGLAKAKVIAAVVAHHNRLTGAPASALADLVGP